MKKLKGVKKEEKTDEFDEKRATGQISYNTYKSLLSFGYGFIILLFSISLFFVAYAAIAMADYSVSNW